MVGGGLLQLVAYGAQDVYLTGSPQITFSRVTYRRYTNFSVDSTISYQINTYGRKYANFEIKYNTDFDELDIDIDIAYPITINLRNLNKSELFEKCQVVKKKKEKKDKRTGSGSGGGMQMFSRSYRSENAANRRHQKQIKAQINMKRR